MVRESDTVKETCVGVTSPSGADESATVRTAGDGVGLGGADVRAGVGVGAGGAAVRAGDGVGVGSPVGGGAASPSPSPGSGPPELEEVVGAAVARTGRVSVPLTLLSSRRAVARTVGSPDGAVSGRPDALTRGPDEAEASSPAETCELDEVAPPDERGVPRFARTSPFESEGGASTGRRSPTFDASIPAPMTMPPASSTTAAAAA